MGSESIAAALADEATRAGHPPTHVAANCEGDFLWFAHGDRIARIEVPDDGVVLVLYVSELGRTYREVSASEAVPLLVEWLGGAGD